MKKVHSWKKDRLHFLDVSTYPNIRVYPSVCRSVRPSVSRFFYRGIQAKKRSNFHQCPCPTFATDAAVYTALLALIPQKKTGRTGRWTDGRTYGRADPLIESRVRD